MIVAAADLLPDPERAHRRRSNGEVLTFTDADALLAFQTIMQRRPKVVALERMFAVTPRGAALINRIKADPTLREAEIRVVAHNSDYTPGRAARGAPRRTGPRPARDAARAALQDGRQGPGGRRRPARGS